MVRWGFVGLGQMGMPMAASVARAGVALTVLHRRDAQSDTARAFGAGVAADAAELAATSDVISICVLDEAQIDALLHGQGLLAAARPGTVFAVHSTVSPRACERWAALAAERGLGLVDAPVSGLPARARAGTLAIFVGGTDADVARCRPGFDAMGATVTHTGPVGAGQVTKILNNLVSLSTVAAITEALRLAEGHGMSRAAVLEAFAGASADSFTLRNWPFFETEWFDGGGAQRVIDLVEKDLGLATDLDPDDPTLMGDAANRALARFARGHRPTGTSG